MHDGAVSDARIHGYSVGGGRLAASPIKRRLEMKRLLIAVGLAVSLIAGTGATSSAAVPFDPSSIGQICLFAEATAQTEQDFPCEDYVA